MKKLATIAVALASAASVPAFAQDVGPYVGVDAGVIFPQHQDFRGLNSTAAGLPVQIGRTYADPYRVYMRPGFDGDINVGYDFGMFRVEAEGGYKWSRVNTGKTIDNNGGPAGQPYNLYMNRGHNEVYSAMANALVDFGPTDGVNFFAGGGAGVAWNRAKYSFNSTLGHTDVRDKDSAFAWQLIAGVRAPLSPNVDVSLKYRYFDAGRFHYRGDLDGLDSRFKSHSVLAGVSFKFGRSGPVETVAPPPPPPPPPPAPAVKAGERG